MSVWDWASPRVWFSVLVGAGATGLVARGFLFEPLVAGLAVVGGLAFERLVVGPIWRFLLRFESRPAHSGRWQYAFFIDVSGHVEDGPVKQALSELGEYATDVKILGSYPVAVL